MLRWAVCILVAAGQPISRPSGRPAPARPPPKAVLRPPIAFPHPLITEVLYAVPPGDDGDAGKDGKRHATGDEFVELVNPHDRPIQLAGYTITDGTALGSGAGPNPRTQVHFRFPDLELAPGAVVVVFGGYKQMIPGPVGDAVTPPAGPNPDFAGAHVFSMKIPSQYVAFSNEADCVVLRDPRGRAVHAISWGQRVPGGAPTGMLLEEAPPGLGSVQRVGLSRTLVPHTDMKPGVLFSPGEFDVNAELPGARPAGKKPLKIAPRPAPLQPEPGAPEGPPPGDG